MKRNLLADLVFILGCLLISLNSNYGEIRLLGLLLFGFSLSAMINKRREN